MFHSIHADGRSIAQRQLLCVHHYIPYCEKTQCPGWPGARTLAWRQPLDVMYDRFVYRSILTLNRRTRSWHAAYTTTNYYIEKQHCEGVIFMLFSWTVEIFWDYWSQTIMSTYVTFSKKSNRWIEHWRYPKMWYLLLYQCLCIIPLWHTVLTNGQGFL